MAAIGIESLGFIFLLLCITWHDGVVETCHGASLQHPYRYYRIQLIKVRKCTVFSKICVFSPFLSTIRWIFNIISTDTFLKKYENQQLFFHDKIFFSFQRYFRLKKFFSLEEKFFLSLFLKFFIVIKFFFRPIISKKVSVLFSKSMKTNNYFFSTLDLYCFLTYPL